MEENKDTSNKNDHGTTDIVGEEQVQQKQNEDLEQEQSVQDDTNISTESKYDSADSDGDSENKSKGKIKNKYKNSKNERYVDGLADRDLKYF